MSMSILSAKRFLGGRSGALGLGFVVLAGLGACASAPSKPTTDPPKGLTALDYFPLDSGWKWAYDLDKDGDHGLATYAVLERTPNTAIVQAGLERLSYAVSRDGVAQKEGAAVGDFVIRNPLALGTSWNVSGGRARIAAVGKAVEVPAGTYADCVVVEATREQPSRMTRTTFAPGVGPVEIEVQVAEQGRYVTTVHASLRGVTKPGQDPLM